MSWRVVVVTRIPPVLAGFDAVVRQAGHETVALLTIRSPGGGHAPGEANRLGWLNGHPSLLPRHRGPLPVAWAIRGGDEEVGITFHLMDAELDTGPILSQRRFPLGEPEDPEVSADRGRRCATGRVRGRAALGRRDRGAQRGRGQLVQRRGSIHALTRRASRLWNGRSV